MNAIVLVLKDLIAEWTNVNEWYVVVICKAKLFVLSGCIFV